MSTPIYVAETACTIDVARDTITESGTAADDCLTFDEATADANIPLASGDEKYISIYDSATPARALWKATWNGTTWEKIKEIQAEGTLAQPGSHTVAIINYQPNTKVIGYHLEWVSASVIRAMPGEIEINGVHYQDGSNVTTLEGDDVTTGTFSGSTDKLYHVFLYDDSGTRTLYFVRRDAAAEDPVYDEDLQYWKAPSTDGDGNSITTPENYRCIGFFRTKSASGNIIEFAMAENDDGNCRLVHFSEFDVAMRFISAGATTTSWTQVELLPSTSGVDVVPKNAISLAFRVAIGRTSGSATAGAGISHTDQGTSTAVSAAPMSCESYVVSGQYFRPGIMEMTLKDSLDIYWRTKETETRLYADAIGARIQI